MSVLFLLVFIELVGQPERPVLRNSLSCIGNLFWRCLTGNFGQNVLNGTFFDRRGNLLYFLFFIVLFKFNNQKRRRHWHIQSRLNHAVNERFDLFQRRWWRRHKEQKVSSVAAAKNLNIAFAIKGDIAKGSFFTTRHGRNVGRISNCFLVF